MFKMKRIAVLFLCSLLLMGCTTKPEQSKEESTEQVRVTTEVSNAIVEMEEEEIDESLFTPYRLEAPYGKGCYVLEVPVDDWHFVIYHECYGERQLMFDLSKDEVSHELISQKAPRKMVVSDEDGDDIEEIYLFFEDEIGDVVLLVLNHPSLFTKGEKSFQSVYLGYEEQVPDYINIDGVGKPELLTHHTGGGGYVTVWEGLVLGNIYRPTQKEYVYSYTMTKKYYENTHAMVEKNLSINPDLENHVRLLSSLSHQGRVEECKKMIEELGAEGVTLKPEWVGPYDTYKEYILAQAKYYKDIWEEIKEWDIFLDEEDEFFIEPLSATDFELPNGIFLGMSYDTYCDLFAYDGSLEFNVGEDGNSTGQALLDTGTIQLVFKWSPDNASSPLLVEYGVTDEYLKTKRGVGLGQDLSAIVYAYGEPNVLLADAVIYWDSNTQLVFELEENIVVRYRVDNGTGLLVIEEE
ncbi:hypothetical protein [Wukongibacter sp. M2B1]|uniref:hypothetical protein n=1 Tax=Wukongibacter sp. M2B1 TaxID=3088895 RepID=UPI003D79DF9F